MTINSTFEWIDPATLTTDLRVQRPADMKRIKDLAARYDPMQVGTIVVSRRADGTMIVLDGQTRIGAKARAGVDGPVHAQVYTGLTLEQEASMFLSRNDSKPVSAIHKFLVRVTEGDPVAVTINSIVESHGWKVAEGTGKGHIQAVNTLERTYTRAGGDGHAVIDFIVGAATSAWGYDPGAVNASVLGGVAEMVLRYGDQVDGEKLVREMQSTAPRALLGRARAMKEAKIFNSALPVIVGRILHTMHNQKLRKTALPEWK